MTDPGNGQQPSFRVELSRSIKNTIKQLHLQAAAKGIGPHFIASLAAIYHRLRQNPREFGEPLFPLPALKLMVYQGVVAPVVVDYVVHEDLPLVFIKAVKLLG